MSETSFGGVSSADRVSEAAASGLGKVKQQASELTDKASSKMENARQPVADKLHGIADKLHGTADAIRDKVESAGEGVGGVAQSAADKLEASASYLESHSTAQMMQDLIAIVKKHPTQSLLLGGAVGFLCVRAFRSD